MTFKDKCKLVAIHAAIDDAMGDTDPDVQDMKDDEIRHTRTVEASPDPAEILMKGINAMARKKLQEVEVTNEAKIGIDIVIEDPVKIVAIASKSRKQGFGLQCTCGARMLVERTRRPGKTYSAWLRKPYRVWRCPRCRKAVRQNLK